MHHTPMNAAVIEKFKARAVASGSMVPDGTYYTRPRTWGVYEVQRGRRFRFGNHPVRQHELKRDLGSAPLVLLFPERALAEALAAELNA